MCRVSVLRVHTGPWLGEKILSRRKRRAHVVAACPSWALECDWLTELKPTFEMMTSLTPGVSREFFRSGTQVPGKRDAGRTYFVLGSSWPVDLFVLFSLLLYFFCVVIVLVVTILFVLLLLLLLLHFVCVVVVVIAFCLCCCRCCYCILFVLF